MRKAFICFLLIAVSSISAGELTIPNSFSPNTPASANQVNANFTAVKTEVDDNYSRIEALAAAVMVLQSELVAAQATISQLETELTAVQDNSVLALDDYLLLSTYNGYVTAEFTGINVMVNNGSDTTESSGGLGNLIVGYNEDTGTTQEFCNNTNYLDEPTCINNGGVWLNYLTHGSHNVIVGSGHSYESYGSIISGRDHVSRAKYTSLVAGERNFAQAIYSGVFGGVSNKSSGNNSSIFGGQGNISSGYASSIGGGLFNTASGTWSSVTGGASNIASGTASSVSGGSQNQAIFDNTSVSGGYINIASGQNSSVSGGAFNIASGQNSSVSGGISREASGASDWVAGALLEDN